MSINISKLLQAILDCTQTYELVDSRELTGFTLHLAVLDLKKFILVEDAKGLHCLNWVDTIAFGKELLDYCENRLLSGIYYPTTVYNFPEERIPIEIITLIPKEV